MAKTPTAKTNGNGASTAKPAKAETKPPSVDTLLKQEKAARAEWYGHFDGAPVKPYSPEQSASLRKLEKAKTALVAATGTSNFKDAAKKLNYSPKYAPRTKKVAAS